MPGQALYGDFAVTGKVTATVPASTATDLVRLQEHQAAVAGAKDRANHVGTQLAATISDLLDVINARIQSVIGTAPAALDTLGEIAAQLASDETAAGALLTRVTALEAASAALLAKVNAHYETTVGNGTASTFTITHPLNSTDVRVEVLDLTLGRQTIYPVVTRTAVDTVVLDFAGAKPTANSVRVLLSARP